MSIIRNITMFIHCDLPRCDTAEEMEDEAHIPAGWVAPDVNMTFRFTREERHDATSFSWSHHDQHYCSPEHTTEDLNNHISKCLNTMTERMKEEQT